MPAIPACRPILNEPDVACILAEGPNRHAGRSRSTARCLCGQVRITAHADPIGVRACWCRVCQYLAAGSATVNVIFAADAVTVTGDLTDHVSTADSGNIMHRRFCSQCGTPMLSASEARPDLVIIRAGAMDDRDGLRPGLAIWTDRAPAWACLDPTIPAKAGPPGPITPKPLTHALAKAAR